MQLSHAINLSLSPGTALPGSFLSNVERAERAGTVRCGEVRHDLINVYKHLKGECKKGRAKLFSVVPRGKKGDNGHKLKHVRFHLNIRKYFFIVQVTALTEVSGGGVSLVGDIQKQSRHGLG